MTLEQKLGATIIETSDLNCELMYLIAHTSGGTPGSLYFWIGTSIHSWPCVNTLEPSLDVGPFVK